VLDYCVFCCAEIIAARVRLALEAADSVAVREGSCISRSELVLWALEQSELANAEMRVVRSRMQKHADAVCLQEAILAAVS
jgi:hypothetical protein